MNVFTHPYRLLLIDDDESIFNLIKRYVDLRYEGLFVIDYCQTLDEAKKYLEDEEKNFHVAFVDIHLDGGKKPWSVVEEMLSTNRGIQIVALSGDETLITTLECYTNGFRYFINKPVDRKKVYDILDRCADHLNYWHELVKTRL
ncbi:response regulator receiver domain protein [Bacteriovorax sp. BSW11_IV]|uniref:response regulator n=1 Tax=Bacteriovorax sp. BSW11_IV TaxID=1353529 RepID=UPI00038A4602|nr:response regulator [Bacteriovorax sp. BSW11_IV]EQC46460.1 response regulator receiver domain protein [Bacteriovorax sp. BSW11_IV]